MLIKHRRFVLKTEKQSKNSGNKPGSILDVLIDQDKMSYSDYSRFLLVRLRVNSDDADASNFYQ